MKDVTQTSELLTFVAKLIRDVDHSRGDDGKVSLPELIGLITTNLSSLITAIMGAGEIPSEARDFTEQELDDLYYLFLTEMGWNPTDDNRDLARAYFLLIRDTYTNILLIMNTKHPMRAELA